MNKIVLTLGRKRVEVKVGLCVDVLYYSHELCRVTYSGGRILEFCQLGGETMLGLTKLVDHPNPEITRSIWISDICEVMVVGSKWVLSKKHMQQLERWNKQIRAFEKNRG